MTVEEGAPRTSRGDVDPSPNQQEPPKSPTRLPRRAWGGVMKRTFKEFQADNLSDLAAALTYYGILAIFPAVIALISIVGLLGHSATQTLIGNLDKLAPGPARQIVENAIVENTVATTNRGLAISAQIVSKAKSRLDQVPTVCIELTPCSGTYCCEAEEAGPRKRCRGVAEALPTGAPSPPRAATRGLD